MLAKAVDGIPEIGDLAFEPKWDGFRCIVFRDGDEVHLGSRNEKPLTRYFPELIEPLKACLPERCVVDGEIIVTVDDHLGFDALQQRIHPADSRVNRLAEETPAEFVAFDVLAVNDTDLTDEPFRDRRRILETLGASFVPPIHLVPSTLDREIAHQWYVAFEGAGLDGLIAKPRDGVYAPNKRTQYKVKHTRTADVVVAGYRLHKDGDGVGSLLVGLHDDRGRLQHMGVSELEYCLATDWIAARIGCRPGVDQIVARLNTSLGGERRHIEPIPKIFIRHVVGGHPAGLNAGVEQSLNADHPFNLSLGAGCRVPSIERYPATIDQNDRAVGALEWRNDLIAGIRTIGSRCQKQLFFVLKLAFQPDRAKQHGVAILDVGRQRNGFGLGTCLAERVGIVFPHHALHLPGAERQ